MGFIACAFCEGRWNGSGPTSTSCAAEDDDEKDDDEDEDEDEEDEGGSAFLSVIDVIFDPDNVTMLVLCQCNQRSRKIRQVGLLGREIVQTNYFPNFCIRSVEMLVNFHDFA